MSAMKRFAEALSIEMGYGGAITPEVLSEGDRILKDIDREYRCAELQKLGPGVTICPPRKEQSKR